MHQKRQSRYDSTKIHFELLNERLTESEPTYVFPLNCFYLPFYSECFSKHQVFLSMFNNSLQSHYIDSFFVFVSFVLSNSRMSYDISISVAGVVNIHYRSFQPSEKQI